MLQIVSEYLSGVLFSFQALFFIKQVSEKKVFVSKKIFFLLLVIFSGFFALSFGFLDGVLKNIVLIIINILMYLLFYRIHFSRSVFLTFIFMGIVMITDLLFLLLLVNVFKMSKDYCYDVFAGSFLAALVIFILFIFVVFLLRKPLKKLLDTQIDTDKKIIILSILTFLGILLFFYTIVEKFQFTDDVILYLMCIIILLVVLFNLIKQVIDNRKLSTKYDKLLEFMTTYENEIEQQRILRHEIKNEFLVVRAKLFDSQKNEEIINYIDEILKDKITVKQEKYAKFGCLPPGIKGLCYLKVQETENKKVQVSINVSKKVKDFDINALTVAQQRNLARILGVFLDNAKEASYLSKDKQMGLEIYFDKDKELKFIISNTFDNEVDVNKIGKEVFSTKGNGRGHGLMLVNYILESNKIFNLKTNVKNNIYIQNLSVKIKNK